MWSPMPLRSSLRDAARVSAASLAKSAPAAYGTAPDQRCAECLRCATRTESPMAGRVRKRHRTHADQRRAAGRGIAARENRAGTNGGKAGVKLPLGGAVRRSSCRPLLPVA